MKVAVVSESFLTHVNRRAMGRAAHDEVLARTWPVVCESLLRHYDEAARSLVVGGS